MREIRQREAVQAYLESDRRSIIYAAPRFGKIKVAIDIMKEKGFVRPLLLYPRKDIEVGWIKDFDKWVYLGKVTFCTFASIKKITDFSIYDFLIID